MGLIVRGGKDVDEQDNKEIGRCGRDGAKDGSRRGGGLVFLGHHPILQRPSCQNNSQLSVSIKNGSKDYSISRRQTTAMETAIDWWWLWQLWPR